MGHHTAGRVCQTGRCPSPPTVHRVCPFQPAVLPRWWLHTTSTVAFGILLIAHQLHSRVWTADPRSRASVVRTSRDGRVARRAPERCNQLECQWRRADAQRSLWASPERRSASRRRNDAGAHTAHPTGFACCATRHVARPHPSVVHCHTAVRLSDWNAVSSQRARPTRHCSRPLRARDRSVFEAVSGCARGRLNAKPFGGNPSSPVPNVIWFHFQLIPMVLRLHSHPENDLNSYVPDRFTPPLPHCGMLYRATRVYSLDDGKETPCRAFTISCFRIIRRS
jgi:hypothetical protein